jgi:hypothetical protein
VPQREWRSFLDSFNRQHDGWLCTLDAVSADQSRRRIASDVSLHGVVLDQMAGKPRISILAGSEGAGHGVDAPAEIIAVVTSDGVTGGLHIKSQNGTASHLSFRSPVAPELVDGVLAA